MQQEQLNILKNLSGVDFKFITPKENRFGIKYYEYKCNTDAEYWDITGKLNQYPEIIYRCIENSQTPSVIVLENELDAAKYDNITENRIADSVSLEPIGKIHGKDIFLEPILTLDNKYYTIVSAWGRAITVVNINGHRLPFYVSSGVTGKEQEYGIKSGKWYPLQGISERWLNKMPDMLNNPYTELDEVCNILEQKFPAIDLRQDAAKGLLPYANISNLLQTANFNFPEGVAISEYTNHTYIKNHCVYLPQIIDAWRSKPNDFLNVSDGILASHGQKILNKIQKMEILCGSKLQEDHIWFYPIEDNKYFYAKYDGFDTDEGIRAALNNMGIYSVYTTRQNEQGFGIPVSVFVDYFEQQKHKGIENLNTPQPTLHKENNKEKKKLDNSYVKRFVGLFKD